MYIRLILLNSGDIEQLPILKKWTDGQAPAFLWLIQSLQDVLIEELLHQGVYTGIKLVRSRLQTEWKAAASLEF